MDGSVANKEYSFSNPRHQSLSLPYGFINYIIKYYSPKVCKKLMMSCKHFFSKKRILVVEDVSISHMADFDNRSLTDFETKNKAICKKFLNNFTNTTSP